jgi:hypothetical protein
MTHAEEEQAWDDGYNYRTPTNNSFEYMIQWEDGKYYREIDDYDNFLVHNMEE